MKTFTLKMMYGGPILIDEAGHRVDMAHTVNQYGLTAGQMVLLHRYALLFPGTGCVLRDETLDPLDPRTDSVGVRGFLGTDQWPDE